MKKDNLITHPLVIISIILSLILGGLSLFEGCKSQSKSKNKTYLDRDVSTYVQNASGIAQKIVLNRSTKTYKVYDKFVAAGSYDWSLSAEGYYSEDGPANNGVIEISFRQNGDFTSLGDYRSAKILMDNDMLRAFSPANTFIGYYRDE